MAAPGPTPAAPVTILTDHLHVKLQRERWTPPAPDDTGYSFTSQVSWDVSPATIRAPGEGHTVFVGCVRTDTQVAPDINKAVWLDPGREIQVVDTGTSNEGDVVLMRRDAATETRARRFTWAGQVPPLVAAVGKAYSPTGSRPPRLGAGLFGSGQRLGTSTDAGQWGSPLSEIQPGGKWAALPLGTALAEGQECATLDGDRFRVGKCIYNCVDQVVMEYETGTSASGNQGRPTRVARSRETVFVRESYAHSLDHRPHLTADTDTRKIAAFACTVLEGTSMDGADPGRLSDPASAADAGQVTLTRGCDGAMTYGHASASIATFAITGSQQYMHLLFYTGPKAGICIMADGLVRPLDHEWSLLGAHAPASVRQLLTRVLSGDIYIPDALLPDLEQTIRGMTRNKRQRDPTASDDSQTAAKRQRDPTASDDSQTAAKRQRDPTASDDSQTAAKRPRTAAVNFSSVSKPAAAMGRPRELNPLCNDMFCCPNAACSEFKTLRGNPTKGLRKHMKNNAECKELAKTVQCVQHFPGRGFGECSKGCGQCINE
jgi:hypothetical protein